MDHDNAIRLMAAEGFLLDDLTPDVRQDFEEHLFSCPECALDLKTGAAFVQQVKVVLPDLETRSVAVPVVLPPRKSLFGWMLPAFSLATVALLFVVAYQAFAAYSKLERMAARVDIPQILPSTSLVSARDTGVPQITAKHNGSALVFLDIPAEHVFPSYLAEFYDPTGKLLWSLPIAGDMAKDTVCIQIPPSPAGSGLYKLVLYGRNSAPNGQTEIRRYTFQLNYEN
jgi:Putative zinc-finger